MAKKDKKDKKQKEKDRKFIDKISKDGRIDKKEAEKAAKKGISLSKIENRSVKNYRDSVSAWEDEGMERRSADKPTYNPLKISSGAERTEFERMMGDYERSNRKNKKGKDKDSNKQVQVEEAVSTQPTNQYQSQIDELLAGINNQQTATPASTSMPDARTEDPYASSLASLEQTIADQQAMFQNQLQQFQQGQAMQMQQQADKHDREEQRRQQEFRVSQANTARSGMTADFRIGGGSSNNTFGTDYFKRGTRATPTGSKNFSSFIMPTSRQSLRPRTTGKTLNI